MSHIQGKNTLAGIHPEADSGGRFVATGWDVPDRPPI